MRHSFARPVIIAFLGALAPLSAWQDASRETPDRAKTPDTDVRLPNGKSQREEILKADYEKTVKDAQQLVELAQGLQEEIERDDRHILSIASLKKTEEIEKLAKRIRTRMRRF